MATRKALCLVSGLFEEVNTPTDKLDFAGNSTTDLAEGTNLYYTNTRARLAISVTDSGGDGSLSYNNTTGVITYTGPSASEVRAHFTAANSGTGFGSLAYDNSTGIFTYSVVTSSNIRQQISVTDSGGSGSLSYDNSTGVITYTGPSSSEIRGEFSVAAGSGLTYNSTTGEFGTSAIPNSQLQNSSITFGSTSVALGSTVTALSITSYTASSFVNVGAGAGSANSINIEPGQIIFEGDADGNETSLQVSNPTADRTITFPDATGTVALLTSLSVAAGSGLTYNSSTGEFGTSSIPNAQLANSSITIGSTSVALGSTAATISGLTSLQSTSLLVGDGTAATPGLRFNSDVDTGIYRIGTNTIGISTNGTHGVALDGTQRLISGHTSAINIGTIGSPYTPRLQVIGTAGGDSDLALLNYGAGNTQLHLGLSGSGTIGTNTAVSTGSSLGAVFFDGTDGTNWQVSSVIYGVAEGTIGTGIVPGRLEFLTANATGVLVERLRIDSSNNFTFSGNPELRINNAANTFRTTLTTAGATANRTITFPDLTGTVLLNTSTLPSTFSDSTFRVQDNSDATKQLAFECSGISTATTRTMTVPNENGTISTQDFATAIAIALG